jgi:hypothetical protein
MYSDRATVLRKMYLVSADQFKPKKVRRCGPYEKWVKFRENMLQEDMGRRTGVKAVADFLKLILPPTSCTPQTESKPTQLPSHKKTLLEAETSTPETPKKPTPLPAIVYETPLNIYP